MLVLGAGHGWLWAGFRTGGILPAAKYCNALGKHYAEEGPRHLHRFMLGLHL